MFAQTNRLRTEGTDHLLAAAKAAGARRFIVQSFAGWPFERTGGPVKSEDDPLQEHPPKTVAETLGAIKHLERVVTEAEGIEGLALRYGGFYGPGTSIALNPDGEQVAMVRKRRLPVVGNGAGIWSFVHIHDAASATAAALDRGGPGVYNVVDDEPAPVSVMLPELAKAIGAKPPRHLPRWVGRVLAGEGMTVMMTEVRGASNEKAKRELGWELRYPSWRWAPGRSRGYAGRSDHARARERDLGDRSELLDDLRPRIFAIAYRMLGSVSEAEDVVQETLLRVHSAIEGGEEISSPRAYAATVATRIAIDELRSARARRETYVGEWLPEPITERPEDDPARQAEVADSLSLAFLVLLESLSPEQRAAFLLHDVFDYDYGRVAEIVGTSEQNARQLASRARRHVQDGRTRFDASAERRDELAASFLAAAEEGDLEGLEAMLAEDVELHGDGGGLAPAIRHPVFGRERVARMLGNWWSLAARLGAFRVRRIDVNGQPGAEYLDADGRLIGVMSLDIAEGKIQAIRSIVNPEKLRHLGPVADANELFARIRESS